MEKQRKNSFKLFWEAAKGSGPDIWVSLQVLLGITLIFAIIFFIAEHNAQPEEYGSVGGFFMSIAWALLRYIGDPGKFAQVAPVTIVGRIIATLIGILGILIFAIPAGVIGGRFRKAIDDDKRERQLDNYVERLRKSFKRLQCRHTLFRTVPRFVSIADIQAKQRIDTKDIIDTIDHNDQYRLRNLATTQNISQIPQDRLVVENIPLNDRRSYGNFINRGSNVTIVSTSSVSEAGIAHFAYYLALYGGFNYVSKEFEIDYDEPVSYYLLDKSKLEEVNKNGEKPMKDFLDDISALATDDKHWTIFLLSASGAQEPLHPTQFHFVSKANKKVQESKNITSTVVDTTRFDALTKAVGDMLLADYDLKTDVDECYRPAGPKYIANYLDGGVKTNAFTLRIAFSVTVWDDRNIAIAHSLAKVLSREINGTELENQKEWKDKGFGF